MGLVRWIVYPWTVRLVFMLFLCLIPSYLLWLLSQGLPLWPVPTQWRILAGYEWLPVIGFAIAVFSGWQGFFRWLATPRIHIEPSNRQPRPIRIPEYAVHHLKVWNGQSHPVLRPLFLALAPEGCQVKSRYVRLQDGQEQVMLFEREGKKDKEEWLFGRWDENPEPLTQMPGAYFLRTLAAGPGGAEGVRAELVDGGQIYNLGASITNRRLPKLFPSEKGGHLDAYPFTVAFAIKKEGEQGFYHFNDETYADPRWEWCDPKWKLEPGIYTMEVRLTGYGLLRAKTASFRLIDGGASHSEFTLEALMGQRR